MIRHNVAGFVEERLRLLIAGQARCNADELLRREIGALGLWVSRYR